MELEEKLCSFDDSTRREALLKLVELVGKGEIEVPPPGLLVNLHCHTFFSYNFLGYSPSRFAWEAKKAGLEVAGIVDFDVLDGLDEFLDACKLLRLKGEVGLETRVFIPEYESREINSPREPGVFYLMGTGFTVLPAPQTREHAILEDMKERAQKRNREMIERINDYLPEIAISYERDVLPLTPRGNPTERHLLEAYEYRARRLFKERTQLGTFLSRALRISEEEADKLIDDSVKLREVMRSKLMKFGGVGYAPPLKGSFPLFSDVIDMTLALDAIPTGTWLDGTSDGEGDPEEFLSFLLEKGIEILQIIPDRNWNIDDPEERRTKVENLRALVETARRLHIPLLAGTEMNKPGQKFVDDLKGPYLKDYLEDFRYGSHILYGHTLLQQSTGLGLLSEASKERFGRNRSERNSFYACIGSRPIPGPRTFEFLRSLRARASASTFDLIASRSDWHL